MPTEVPRAGSDIIILLVPVRNRPPPCSPGRTPEAVKRTSLSRQNASAAVPAGPAPARGLFIRFFFVLLHLHFPSPSCTFEPLSAGYQYAFVTSIVGLRHGRPDRAHTCIRTLSRVQTIENGGLTMNEKMAPSAWVWSVKPWSATEYCSRKDAPPICDSLDGMEMLLVSTQADGAILV